MQVTTAEIRLIERIPSEIWWMRLLCRWHRLQRLLAMLIEEMWMIPQQEDPLREHEFTWEEHYNPVPADDIIWYAYRKGDACNDEYVFNWLVCCLFFYWLLLLLHKMLTGRVERKTTIALQVNIVDGNHSRPLNWPRHEFKLTGITSLWGGFQ